ncbi:unnamed protein product, partial [Coregonus sp. 'balchen']
KDGGRRSGRSGYPERRSRSTAENTATKGRYLVVEQGMFVKHCKVEVYLTELKLCEDRNMDNVVTRRFSKADTIDTIEKEMRKLFSIPDEKETRLWNKYMSNTFEPLNKPDNTIQDAGLYQGQKNEDGSWPRGSSAPKLSGASNLSALPKISPSSLTNNHNSSFNSRNVKNSSYSLPSYHPYNSYECSEGRQSEQAGLCGLSNLGNTCFMNSALQCLSNVPPLTEYFLKDKYKDELNEDNPLGMKGEIAKAYADITKQSPRWFSGYQQQDSHELLAFLLDGLHEDLNRIRKKPYILLKDAEGRPDKVVAEEAWENHIKRNDSIIVDIFHGLFKSTLVCPVCAKYKLTVPKVGYISDLCTSLSTLSDVPAEKNLSSIMERDDIYVFEVAVNRLEDTDHVVIPVHLREKYKQSGYNHTSTPLRFVRSVIEEDDTEETTPSSKEHTVNGNATNGVMEEGSPSEMETDEQDGDDESSQDKELPSENDNSQSEDSVGGGDNELENGVGPEGENSGTKCHQNQTSTTMGEKNRLFTFQFNNMGKTDFSLIKEEPRQIRFDEGHLRLSDRSYLSLDWEPEDFEKHESMEYKPQKKAFFKLKDCIELFTTKEKLGAEDPWYCPNCKEHQQATKKLDLWSLPPVLVIHLKRFSYSRYMRDKLDSLVDFPLSDMEMSEFLIDPNTGPCRYDLIAVSNHYGGMGGGHYTAYAKNKDDGKWYNFDDSSVSPANEDQIVSKAAYVLFYQRQDTVKGTGYFDLDREEEEREEVEENGEGKEERKSVASTQRASASVQSDKEDVNDNKNEKKQEEQEPSCDVTMKTN